MRRPTTSRPITNERGAIAILFALLIVALTASVAAGLAYDIALDTRRTTSLLWQEQARLVAYGAEDWVGDVLIRDRQDSETDHFGELWAIDLPPLPVDAVGISGIITGEIEDLQGRFNLNTLINAEGKVDEAASAHFQRLLKVLEMDPQLAQAVVDWIDTDSEVSFPGGAEDDVYTARVPPLKTANQAFRSTGELAIIEGIDAEGYARLRPHVVALPARTLINVNTATPAVLQSLSEQMDPAEVERIMAERADSGIEDMTVAFGGLLDARAISDLADYSEYFRLRSVVRIGTVRFTMYSLLHRNPDGRITVLMRSFGTE